jgi:hypothetical protein
MVHPFFKKIILKSALFVLFLGGLGMNEVSAVASRMGKLEIVRKVALAPFRAVRVGSRNLAKGTANKLRLRKKRVDQQAANKETEKLKGQQVGFPQKS